MKSGKAHPLIYSSPADECCDFGSNTLADTSREVFISGKIGNQFDDKKVKIIDNLGQVYFLSRHLFPKDVAIKQGQSFAFEVHEKELNKVKFLKK